MVLESGHRTTYGSKDKNQVGSTVLSSIYGGYDNEYFSRLESNFRTLQAELNLERKNRS